MTEKIAFMMCHHNSQQKQQQQHHNNSINVNKHNNERNDVDFSPKDSLVILTILTYIENSFGA